MTINEFLIKQVPTSTKQAISIIQEKRVFINSLPAHQQQLISNQDNIVFDEKIIQEARPNFYIAYYKPRGIECTMSLDIKNNLSEALPVLPKPFFPIGRLDKESEGLLLLTNDGHFYRQIAPPDAFKEKEYIVTVDKLLTEEAIQQLASGVIIMGQKTRPAAVFKADDCTFRIILTQGLNRQIRRMCYKLDYEVLSLKRIRIMSIELGNLNPGEFYALDVAGLLA
jgi:23S rRNA pseudouridine2604 synthase